MQNSQIAEVLIVGAGPVGLTLAIILQRNNIPHKIVEKRQQRQPFSKAFAIHSRTLEVFEDLGILDKVLSKSLLVTEMHIYSNGKRLINYSFKSLDIPYQFVASIPQGDIENILVEEYQRLGGHVEEGVELMTLAQEKHTIKTELVNTDSLINQYDFRYVLACDGSKSRVRELMNVPFDGSEYDTPYIIADGVLNWSGDLKAGHVFVSEGGYIMFFPLPNNRCRVVVDDRSGKLKPSDLTVDVINEHITQKGIRDAIFSEPSWLTITRFSRKLIDNYRHGNVFFSGDASHVHSPFGGQGLNTGLQDAYNLGWKVSHTIKYNASPDLLASFNSERRPVAQIVLAKTDQQMKLLSVSNVVMKFLRDRIIPRIARTKKFQQQVVGQASGYLVNYNDSDIVSQTANKKQGMILAGNRMKDVILSGYQVFYQQVEEKNTNKRLFDLLKGTHYSLFVVGTELTNKVVEEILPLSYHDNDFFRFFAFIEDVSTVQLTAEIKTFYHLIYTDKHGNFRYKTKLTPNSLLLVRPDGYIAFQGNDVVSLINYIQRLYSNVVCEQANTMAQQPKPLKDKCV
jgi:2-polyprenyl-6-methoxyphenol hydroxylase-like FAD-dependent oxidoreductase